MSNPPPSATPASATNNTRFRNLLTLGSIAVFILGGILAFLYWFLYGQFYESTDDAYVNGNMITIAPLEEGIITAVYADNAQLIKGGEPLVLLDPHDYEIALDKAKADLANMVRKVSQMFIQVQELEAKREIYKADLIRSMRDYEHRIALVDDGSIAKEDFEHSQTTLYAAFGGLQQTENQLKSAIAAIQNTEIATHPLVEEAKSTLREAFLGLHRCTILSPVEGLVGQRAAQVGQKVKATTPLMAIVPINEMWVDANLREVNLKNIRIGQPVTLVSDMYGRSMKFHGKVVGLYPGTGSVFSVLPPQNATGNWIKIVQRVPVKIALDPEEVKQYPLVLGLSMTVKIDTHFREGRRLPEATLSKPLYVSQVYDHELAGSDELIQEIIENNTFKEP